jgi:hypothetical protein
MTKRGVTVLAAAVLVMTAAPAFAKGWVVRICRGTTEASAIKISVGEPGSTDTLLVNWQSDNLETDFPVPAKLKKAKSLHVAADSEPADGKVAMCVLYKGTATKAMNFNDLLEVTASQKGTDSACKCPKSGK